VDWTWVAFLLRSTQNMVTTGLINFGYLIISWVLSLLPVYTGFPTEMQNAITWIGGTGAGLSCIVPVDTYRAQIVIIVYLAIILLGIRFFAWIFNREMKHPDGKSA